jgi:hypothetical protein
MKMIAFWDIAPCSIAVAYRPFRRACNHHHGDVSNTQVSNVGLIQRHTRLSSVYGLFVFGPCDATSLHATDLIRNGLSGYPVIGESHVKEVKTTFGKKYLGFPEQRYNV